eukprot:m.86012 g.86012  ORF g.86012 m.86012 type:complete len:473 (-) comp19811_c0_seq1:540-1958(-)
MVITAREDGSRAASIDPRVMQSFTKLVDSGSVVGARSAAVAVQTLQRAVESWAARGRGTMRCDWRDNTFARRLIHAAECNAHPHGFEQLSHPRELDHFCRGEVVGLVRIDLEVVQKEAVSLCRCKIEPRLHVALPRRRPGEHLPVVVDDGLLRCCNLGPERKDERKIPRGVGISARFDKREQRCAVEYPAWVGRCLGKVDLEELHDSREDVQRPDRCRHVDAARRADGRRERWWEVQQPWHADAAFEDGGLALPEHVPSRVHDVGPLSTLVRSVVCRHDHHRVGRHRTGGHCGPYRANPGVHLRESAKVVGVVLVEVVVGRHGGMGLVDRVQAEVRQPRSTIAHPVVEKRREPRRDEERVIPRHLVRWVAPVCQPAHPTDVARVGLVVVGARIPPVRKNSTRDHALIASGVHIAPVATARRQRWGVGSPLACRCGLGPDRPSVIHREAAAVGLGARDFGLRREPLVKPSSAR